MSLNVHFGYSDCKHGTYENHDTLLQMNCFRTHWIHRDKFEVYSGFVELKQTSNVAHQITCLESIIHIRTCVGHSGKKLVSVHASFENIVQQMPH